MVPPNNCRLCAEVTNTSVQEWYLTTSSEPWYSVKSSCLSLLYFNIKILQKSSDKIQVPSVRWNVIVVLIITTAMLVSLYQGVTPQHRHGGSRVLPCFYAQGLSTPPEPLTSYPAQVPQWPSLGPWPTVFSLHHDDCVSSKPLALLPCFPSVTATTLGRVICGPVSQQK